MKKKILNITADILILLFGGMIYGIGANVFIIPKGIVLGGAAGIATTLHYIRNDLPVGLVIICINIPLLFAAMKTLGKRFVFRTAFAVLFFSAFIDIFSFLPAFGGDILLSSVFGGVLCGGGIGIMMIRNFVTGGSDLLARILRARFPHIAMGRLVFIIDAAVVLSAGLIFRNITVMLYSVITIYILSVSLDAVISGSGSTKTALIITGKTDEMKKAIIAGTNRTVTVVKAQGGYGGSEKGMIVSAIANNEIGLLKKAVIKADENAFVMMLETKDIFGLGFRNITDK